MKRLDKKIIPDRTSEIRCFFCGRNESRRIPEFLSYHKRIGVDRFFFIDNGSTDNSVEIALADESVHVWMTEQIYKESRFGVDWQEALLERYGVGYWCLLLDLDEFFYYPFCDQGRSFQEFLSSQDTAGNTVIKSIMLDMYSDRPIFKTLLESERSIFDICPYFDRPRFLSLCFSQDFHRLQQIYFQGVRQRVFSASAMIRKYPLLRYSKDMCLSAGHHHLPSLAYSYGGERTFLFHFKFLSSLYEYARDSIYRECHWNDSSEYKQYFEKMECDPNLNLYDPKCSIRFRDSGTFLEQRMIYPRCKQKSFKDRVATLLHQFI